MVQVSQTQSTLWDIAGADGLAVARALFGATVDYLAPFQSLETTLQGEDCSVLRLCDRNFRLLCKQALPALITPPSTQVWVKSLPWLATLSLPDTQFPILAKQAITRPPHRITDLPNHCAVPAQIQGISLLIWRHVTPRRKTVDLQVSQAEVDQLCHILTKI